MPTEGTINYSRGHASNSRENHMGSDWSALARLGRVSVRALFGISVGLLVGCETTVAVQDDEKTCLALSKTEIDYSQVRPIVEDIVGAATRRQQQQQRAAAVDLATACAGKAQCVVLVDGQCYAVSSR